MRIALGVVIGFVCIGLLGCHGDTPAESTAVATSATTGSAQTSPAVNPQKGALTKLKIDDVKVGTGDGAKNGDQLTMLYTGTLADGTVFDTNDKSDGTPFKFELGAGSVIKGWDQGLVGMKTGGERKLSIPADLGYGNQAKGAKIPPNSDLYFDVKMKNISRKEDRGMVLLNDKKFGTGPAVKKGDAVEITFTTTGDDGTIVDDRNAKTPYKFTVGNGDVRPVMEQGILGMKKGGERILTVPGELLQAGPAIHPGMTATIDIHLLSVRS